MSFAGDVYRDFVIISQPGILDSFHLNFLGKPPHKNFIEDKGKGVDYDSGTTSVTEPTDAPAGAKLDVPSKAKEDPSKPPNKRPRYSTSKTQALEKIFQKHKLPTEIQRKKLSDEIGLEENKIKYWFQNRRNQEKVRRERHENQFLRKEIDQVRAENDRLKEALDKIAISNSGGGSLGSSSYHNLNLELRTLLPSGSASPFEGLPAGEAGGDHDAGLDGSLLSYGFRMPVPAENNSLSSKNPFDYEF